MVPYRVRRGGMVGRQVLRSLPCRHDIEAARARPLHQLAREGRLIAVGHRVDNPCRACLGGQQRSGQHVRFHVHHHDVPSRRERGAGMPDPGGRIPGRLDHDLDAIVADGIRRICREPRRRETFVAPTGGATGSARAIGIQVSDHRHFHRQRGWHLAQEHRAELAGADQGHANRPARIGARTEFVVEIHRAPLRQSRRPARARRDSRRPAERWARSRDVRSRPHA